MVASLSLQEDSFIIIRCLRSLKSRIRSRQLREIPRELAVAAQPVHDSAQVFDVGRHDYTRKPFDFLGVRPHAGRKYIACPMKAASNAPVVAFEVENFRSCHRRRSRKARVFRAWEAASVSKMTTSSKCGTTRSSSSTTRLMTLTNEPGDALKLATFEATGKVAWACKTPCHREEWLSLSTAIEWNKAVRSKGEKVLPSPKESKTASTASCPNTESLISFLWLAVIRTLPRPFRGDHQLGSQKRLRMLSSAQPQDIHPRSHPPIASPEWD